MEPVTTAVVGKFLWDSFGEPVLDSAKNQYGDRILKALDRFKFKKKERKVIEVELVEADKEVFSDEQSLIAYLQNNEKINDVLKHLNKRESNINIKVEKGVGMIGTMNGDMNF